MAVKWHGDRFLGQLKLTTGQNLQAAAYHLQNKVREAISVANTPRIRLRSGRYIGLSPSSPGQPPRKLSGHLRRTITTELSPAKDVARVGTNLPYGKYLELGTRGGREIVAGTGRAIPIVISGALAFRRRVRRGPMAARPFLVPTLEKNAASLARIAAVNRTI